MVFRRGLRTPQKVQGYSGNDLKCVSSNVRKSIAIDEVITKQGIGAAISVSVGTGGKGCGRIFWCL